MSAISEDAKGFVQTGADLVPANSSANNRSGATMPLESSIRGIFAVGAVRYGSVRRVGAAIGEGAAVVAELHSFLAGSSTAARPRTASS